MERNLHKYLSLNGEDRLRWALGYLKGSAYYASPNNFNDPFELSATLSPPSREAVDEFFRGGEEAIRGFSKTAKRKIHERVSRGFLREAPKALSSSWLDDVGMLCLSENNNDLLMWAHYADNHAGICLGLDWDMPPFSGAFKVEYSDQRPQVSLNVRHGVAGDSLRSLLLVKSTHWSYEKEWRVIKRKVRDDELEFYYELSRENPDRLDEIAEVVSENGGPGLYGFEPEAVRVIYLGARISAHNRRAILSAAKQMEYKVRVIQMGLHNRDFVLTEDKVRY